MIFLDQFASVKKIIFIQSLYMYIGGLVRVRRDTPYGAPPPVYGAAPRGRVGPVYTFVKTDPQV